DEARSADLDARLVLLLANQCGDQAVLLDCIRAAAEAGTATRATACAAASGAPGRP
ncbi:DUF2783 domain-containing protein, partial [Verminephrobacter eiseniae]